MSDEPVENETLTQLLRDIASPYWSDWQPDEVAAVYRCLAELQRSRARTAELEAWKEQAINAATCETGDTHREEWQTDPQTMIRDVMNWAAKVAVDPAANGGWSLVRVTNIGPMPPMDLSDEVELTWPSKQKGGAK